MPRPPLRSRQDQPEEGDSAGKRFHETRNNNDARLGLTPSSPLPPMHATMAPIHPFLQLLRVYPNRLTSSWIRFRGLCRFVCGCPGGSGSGDRWRERRRSPRGPPPRGRSLRCRCRELNAPPLPGRGARSAPEAPLQARQCHEAQGAPGHEGDDQAACGRWGCPGERGREVWEGILSLGSSGKGQIRSTSSGD